MRDHERFLRKLQCLISSFLFCFALSEQEAIRCFYELDLLLFLVLLDSDLSHGGHQPMRDLGVRKIPVITVLSLESQNIFSSLFTDHTTLK